MPVCSRGKGVLESSDFDQAVSDKTKVICVSSVQWSSGFRLDMHALGEMCRQRGIWLVVDAIHEMGAMEIDVSRRYADFVFAGGHKWLNSPYGCGLMYVSQRALDELDAPLKGYLALEAPQGGWGEYFRTPDITPFREYRFPRTAKQFETGGTSNYPGAVALGKSLKLVNELGIDACELQIRRLGDLVYRELEALGVDIISDPRPKHRSGITVFQVDADAEKNKEILAKLLDAGIYLAMRYTAGVGGIRVSTHFFNHADDIYAMIEVLRQNL